MTTTRNTLASLLFALACATPAFAQQTPAEEPASGEKADAQVERIASDTEKYLDELDTAIGLAKKGVYGKLPKGASAKLDESRDLIGKLLDGDRDPRSLEHDQRLALYNAHETIAAIVNNDDKSRVVCKREQHLGSRVATTECLTIGEREELATRSSSETADLQRTTCSPGETSRCAKSCRDTSPVHESSTK
jgi:hypothetical protein